MPYYTLQTTKQLTHYILLTSDIDYNNTMNKKYNTPNPSHFHNNRLQSQLGTDSYSRSLRRAFSRAKQLAFFNPDLTQFITLTYKQNQTDPLKALQDIKNLIKQQKRIKQKRQKETPDPGISIIPPQGVELSTFPSAKIAPVNPLLIEHSLKKNKDISSDSGCGNVDNSVTRCISSLEKTAHFERKNKIKHAFKYIYVFEIQKRGAIHVHMVANDYLDTKMVNGRLNVVGWQQHGFSDVKTIKNTDNNFKPYLYLFKYMQKAQRIGGSFIHVSRNFDKISSMEYSRYINTLSEVHLLYKEDYEFTVNNKSRKITKEYLRNVSES